MNSDAARRQAGKIEADTTPAELRGRSELQSAQRGGAASAARIRELRLAGKAELRRAAERER